MKKFKWGILGPGTIAHKFAQGFTAIKDAEIAAVGSRSMERANAFAELYGIPKRYASYAELAQDPELDAIYIATPNPCHYENSVMCLEAGKPVLCEKPFTLNAEQTAKAIQLARKKRLFFMEAMWTRCLPVHYKVREWLARGEIGSVQVIQADFGFRDTWSEDDRHISMALGGGALLDIGVYPIAFSYNVTGRAPSKVESISTIGRTGADEQTAVLLGFDKGETGTCPIAVLTSSFTTKLTDEAWVFGTKGHIRIENFWYATSATLHVNGREDAVFQSPFLATGYEYEAMEAMKCIREGKLESPLMPLDESLSIMQTMDLIREQIGVKYPGE